MTEKLGVNEKEPAFGQKTPTNKHTNIHRLKAPIAARGVVVVN